jgi:hypothetical protein
MAFYYTFLGRKSMLSNIFYFLSFIPSLTEAYSRFHLCSFQHFYQFLAINQLRLLLQILDLTANYA